MRRVDVAILGSGFGGSLLAMALRQRGLSVALVERGAHPRFAIGESSTPLANLLLEEIARAYELDRVLPLAKWGSWQAHYPQLGCGLKRGFSFFFPGDQAQPAPCEQALLFAASPHDTVADTHWFRADVDAFLVGEAQRMGVEYCAGVSLREFAEHEQGVELAGDNFALSADFVVDATGPRGALHTLLSLGEERLPGMAPTQALYTHFRDVRASEPVCDGAPYPVDDAAVHHLFPGGWVWLLRFHNGITSAGVVATEAVATELQLGEGEPAWRRLCARLPALAQAFAQASAVRPYVYQQQVQFCSAQMVGRRWAMLPSAAGFVDPLLSTGFPLTLLGVQRLAAMLAGQPGAAELAAYEAHTRRELWATAHLVSALYANFARPVIFQAVTLVYFAAATWAESARRLGRAELAPGFLLCDEPAFAQVTGPLLAEARTGIAPGEDEAFLRKVQRALEPWDAAGLAQVRTPAWYPVEAEDLRRGAHKLRVTAGDVDRMLARAGFFAPV